MLELRPRDLALPLGRRLDARHQNSSPPAGGVSARSSAFLCHVWLCPTGPYSAALYPAGLPLIAALPITPHSRTPHRRSHARCWLRPRSPSSPFQRSTRGSCVCTRTYSLLLPLRPVKRGHLAPPRVRHSFSQTMLTLTTSVVRSCGARTISLITTDRARALQVSFNPSF